MNGFMPNSDAIRVALFRGARRLSYALLTVISLAIIGCTHGTGPSKENDFWGAITPAQRIDTAMLQRDLMNFADRFGGRMSDGYDQLADSSTTYAAKDMALDRKIDSATAAYINAVDPSPIVGLMDMLVMVRLVRQSCEDPWFTELFGKNGQNIVALLKVEEDYIWRIGARYLTASQLAELSDAIERWRRAHPNQRYVAMARLSDFPEAKLATTANSKGPSSVFALLFLDPLSGLDPAVREVERSRETAERMFFYLQRMPILLSWEAESVSRRMLAAPQLQQFVDNSSKFADSTSRFADSTRAVADSVAKFPQFVTEERQRAVDQLAQKLAVERDAAIRQSADAIAVQRDAAVKQVAQAVAIERDQIVHSATTSVAEEREATINQLNASIQSQRQALVNDMEAAAAQSINRLFRLAMVVVVVAIALTALVMFGLQIRREAGLRKARQE